MYCCKTLLKECLLSNWNAKLGENENLLFLNFIEIKYAISLKEFDKYDNKMKFLTWQYNIQNDIE